MLQTSSEMIWKKKTQKILIINSTIYTIWCNQSIRLADGAMICTSYSNGWAALLYFLRRSSHTRMTRRKNEIFDCRSNLLRESFQKFPVIFRISTFYLGATTTRSSIEVVVDSAFIVVKHKTSVSLLMRLEPSSWLFYDVMCAVESPRLSSALYTQDSWRLTCADSNQTSARIPYKVGDFQVDDTYTPRVRMIVK